jgi:hypothetical protein
VKLRDTKPFYLRRLTYFLALCAVCRWQLLFNQRGQLLRRSLPPSVIILFQGILVYISQGVVQDARLVKNLTTSVTMVAPTKASPVRKRVRVLVTCLAWLQRR